MAKSRATSAKSRKSGTRKKTASRKKTTARRRARGPRQVQLKPVFNRINTSLAQLRRVEQTRDVKNAITRLTRCLKEIDDICAPDMIIPIEG